MRLSKQGAADIRLHEGFVDHWYLDPVGIPTIGVGFTWRSAAFRDWWSKRRPGEAFQQGASMSRAEADDCLVALADQEYGAAVNRFLGRVVMQNVFDGGTSVVFNCGAGALEWSWAGLMRSGDYAGAADKLRVTAITAKKPNGERVELAGLKRRRADEARLIEFGVYLSQGEGVPMTEPVDEAIADGVLIRGERGPSVANLQRDLIRHGFQPGKVDGLFGYGTEAAVMAFQKAHGLTADGYAGPLTLKALGA